MSWHMQESIQIFLSGSYFCIGLVVTLKIGRREDPGSNPGHSCRPSHSEFSVVFSETRVGQDPLGRPPTYCRPPISPGPTSGQLTFNLQPTIRVCIYICMHAYMCVPMYLYPYIHCDGTRLSEFYMAGNQKLRKSVPFYQKILIKIKQNILCKKTNVHFYDWQKGIKNK